MTQPVFKDLLARYPSLQDCERSLHEAAELLLETFRGGGKMLIVGNGGSAADADHISGELLKSFGRPRRITGADRVSLGDELADKLDGALPAIPLPQFAAFISAFANDRDADYAFAQLVWALGKKGDVLFGISTSGNSRNILHAVDVAHRRGLKVIALTSCGGKLRERADVAICVPGKQVHIIQELHLPVYHAICGALEEEMF